VFSIFLKYYQFYCLFFAGQLPEYGHCLEATNGQQEAMENDRLPDTGMCIRRMQLVPLNFPINLFCIPFA
jgi:hypothetical protein